MTGASSTRPVQRSPAIPAFDGERRGVHGERIVTNALGASANELRVDRDIMVLANPEIAGPS